MRKSLVVYVGVVGRVWGKVYALLRRFRERWALPGMPGADVLPWYLP